MDNSDWDLFAIVRSCKASTFTPHATISETPPLPLTPTTTNTTTNTIISHENATSSYFDNFTFANRNSLISFATNTIPIPTTTIPSSNIPIIIANTTSIPTLSTTTVPEKITTTTNTMTNTDTSVYNSNQRSTIFYIPTLIEQQLMQPNKLTELEKLKQNFNHNTIIPIPTTTSHTFNFAAQTTNNTTITPVYTTTTFTTPTLTSTICTPINTNVAPTTTAMPTIITNTTTIPTITTTTPKKMTTTTTLTTPIYTTTTFSTPTSTIRTPTTTRSNPSTTIIPTIITNIKSSPTTIIPTISTTTRPTYITPTTNTITNINNNIHNSNQSTAVFDIPTLIKQQNELIKIGKLKLNFNQSTTVPIPKTTFRTFNITNPNPTNTTNIPIYTTPISTICTHTTSSAPSTATTFPTLTTNTASSPITIIPTRSTTTTTTNTITNTDTNVHYSNQNSTFFDFPTLTEQQLMQPHELKELTKFELDFNSNTIIPMSKTTFGTFSITNPTTTTAITPIYTTTTFTTSTPTSTICTPTTTTGTPTLNNTNINIQGTNQFPTVFHFSKPIKQQIQSNNHNQVFVPKHATSIKITNAHFDRAYNYSSVPQQSPPESNQLSLIPQIDSQILSNTHLQEPKHKSRKRKNNDYMRFEGHMIVEKPKEDSWSWRKYGQKSIIGSPHPRSYFKCSFRNCPARKLIQKSTAKENTYVVAYDREHNHEKPTDNLNSVIRSSWNKSSHTRLSIAGNFHSPDVAMLQFDQPESSNARVLIDQSKFPYPETELVESRLHARGEARSISNVRNIGSPNATTLQFNDLESNNGHVRQGESRDTKFTGSLYDDCDILIEKMETMLEDFLLDFNNLRALFP